MKNFTLDVWHDLRGKRLWPVALALVLALVAVPVLLLKGAPEASLSEQSAPSPSPGAETPAVTFDETSLAGSSKLGAFDEKNPFRSQADPVASEAAAAPGADGAPDASDLAGGGEAPLSGGGTPSAAGDPMASSGASPGGSSGSGSPDPGGSGSSEPSGSGSGSTPQPSPEPPTPADPKFYEYTAEVDFGREGKERRYRDVRALDSLPRKSNPVVVYLGQTRENESAFLVNQVVSVNDPRNEGNCVPNKIDCSIVYLRPKKDQDDHYFSTGPPPDYHLKLIAVRRKIDGRDPSARSSATSSESRTPTSGKRSKQTVRRTRFDFRIPMIAGRRR